VHPNSGFLAGIVGGWLSEDIQTYRVFLETVGCAGQGLFGQVSQEIPLNFRGSKGLALEDALDLRITLLHFKNHLT
jgi:hypothetical protein